METAYVLLNCDLGYEEAVIEDLEHIDSVKEIHGVYGAYDIIARVKNSEREKPLCGRSENLNTYVQLLP